MLKKMHATRTRKRPQRVKKWLRSPHNKFKQQVNSRDSLAEDPSNQDKESTRSHSDDTKVNKFIAPKLASARTKTLIGIFITLACCCNCYCLLATSQLAVFGQPSQAKSSRNNQSAASNVIKPLDEEEVSIVQQKQVLLEQTAIDRSISNSSATLVTSSLSLPANSTGDSQRRARRKPRVFKLRAAPMNGRLSGPVVRLELADALERLPAKLITSTSQLPEQFGTRTAGAKTAQSQQVAWSGQQREPKMFGPTNQEQAPDNSTEPFPPPEAAKESGKPKQLERQQQSASVAASSPMLRLTTSQNQPSSALAAASSPNLTQQVGPTQVSLAEEGPPARLDGETIFSLIDEYDSKIITNRTRAQLSCDSGEMVLRLNFSDPFKGIVYPERNRLSPCRFFGDGHNNYELRLPLRGCGTRQAAPRVFVNDVIVRFHKSLELEEDEVKTLICRYPPPLAPSPQLGDASYQGDPKSTTAATIITTSTTAGGSVEQEGGARFEFVDAATGKPEPGGSSGNIDTVSENLVIAPNVQQQHLDSGYTNRLGPIRRQPDLFNQRNSPLIDPTSGLPSGGGRIASMTNQQQESSGFFSGLSSIELLFLISTLMFLVLLALGLTASYYCFRRHNNRRSAERASAILKRKRRYVSPANLLSAHQAAAAAAAAGMPSPAMHQHHYYPPGGQSRQQPSSPDSDLSARSLLAGGTYAPSNVRYALNRGFVPDTGPKPSVLPVARGQYMASSVPYKPQVIGRRGEATYTQAGPYLQKQQHYLAHQRTNSQFAPALQPIAPGYGTSRKNLHHQWPLYLVNEAHMNKENDIDYAAQAQSLSRAKSLSSVNHDALQRQWNATGGRNLAANQPATLSRSGNVATNRWTSEFDYRPSQRRRRYMTEQSTINSSGKDAFERVGKVEYEMNNNSTDHFDASKYSAATKQHKPKIILKSIEDSFITNVTEIHEQEYCKRDSLRPLDLAEWRAMQPQVKKASSSSRRRKRSCSTSDNNSNEGGTSGDDLLPPPPPPPLSSQGEQHRSDNEEEFYHSEANTNLRSLTELDVNFARSLLSGPSLVQPQALSTSSDILLRPAISAGHLAQSTRESRSASLSRQRRERRASSVPEVTVEDKLNQACDERPMSESPDLILSPEYDCSRLELAKPKSSSPHNSVSYV